eukprot:3602544-Prymnesium_polylepis.1
MPRGRLAAVRGTDGRVGRTIICQNFYRLESPGARCRSPGWVRSVEECRFGAQSCCGTSQRCVRPRRRT